LGFYHGGQDQEPRALKGLLLAYKKVSAELATASPPEGLEAGNPALQVVNYSKSSRTISAERLDCGFRGEWVDNSTCDYQACSINGQRFGRE